LQELHHDLEYGQTDGTHVDSVIRSIGGYWYPEDFLRGQSIAIVQSDNVRVGERLQAPNFPQYIPLRVLE
jgi:hypothetical protein